jgi:hypothetical protein
MKKISFAFVRLLPKEPHVVRLAILPLRGEFPGSVLSQR